MCDNKNGQNLNHNTKIYIPIYYAPELKYQIKNDHLNDI